MVDSKSPKQQPPAADPKLDPKVLARVHPAVRAARLKAAAQPDDVSEKSKKQEL